MNHPNRTRTTRPARILASKKIALIVRTSHELERLRRLQNITAVWRKVL